MSRDTIDNMMIAADDYAELAAAAQIDDLDRELDAMVQANAICVKVDAMMRAKFDFCDALEVYCGFPVQY